MRTYDQVVIGSGVSGLTSALLLAKEGNRVLMIEKARTIGGSLLRFRRKGVPFDTGFHFTGGFGDTGLLTKMLEVLGLSEKIHPVLIPRERSQRIVFEGSQSSYELPSGIEEIRQRITSYFPEEKAAIDRYFDKVISIYLASAEIIFQEEDPAPVYCPEEAISLQEMLDEMTGNPELKALLSIFCMCYGTKPQEVSFATHSRVCYSLFQSLARIEGGGDALIAAFEERLKALGVEIRCNCQVLRCGQMQGRNVQSFHLSDGEEVAFGSAVLTIHPQEILKLLPQEFVRPALRNRVGGFEESTGFFSIFATLDLPEEQVEATITSLLPSEDLNFLLSSDSEKDSALVIVRSRENVNGRIVHTLTAFEPSSPKEVSLWANTRTGKRPADYKAYKTRRAARIMERILRAYPQYEGRLELVDSASVLTYRDWLNSPAGAAYGIKQKTNQVNLMGRLPLTNLFAAGQSALLPGVVGAMMSSFIVCRSLLGISSYQQPVCS